MRSRCENPKDKDFPQYGGRGIFVCERWQSFENFHSDMGDRPPGLTIERINNDGPYAPDNCRWATQAEQAQNKRTARFLTYEGRTMRLREWALATDIPLQTIASRLRSGWSPEDALATTRRRYAPKRDGHT